MLRDPVCGTRIDERDAIRIGLTSDHLEHTYCFCSEDCKARFDDGPDAFSEQFNEWEEWNIPEKVWKED